MSLRLRLLLAAVAAALVALVVAEVVTYSTLRSSLYRRLDQDLAAAMPTGAPGGHGGPPHGGPGPAAGGGPLGGGGAFVAILQADGHLNILSYGTEPGGKPYTPALPGNLQATGAPGRISYFTTASTVATGPTFRVAVTGAPEGGLHIAALPLSATIATLHQLLLIELAVTGGALVVALALGWWLVRVALRPLVAIETTAGQIADGVLEARIPGDDRRTEVGHLARSLNIMLARIQRAFTERDATETELRSSEERLRRFVADASHELRTPLAAVSAYAELFTRGASEHPADLDRVMKGIRSESARMTELVDDLLLLARLDEGRPLGREPLDLVELLADSIHAANLVGPGWPVTLEATTSVEVTGDRARLRQVFDNLIGNIRAHTPEGTPATISVQSKQNEAVVDVIDQGPGLHADEWDRVFERFYRTDTSRARSTGGTGLGLSIVWAIVHAHGGQVEGGPGPQGGARFTVRLPMTDYGALEQGATDIDSQNAP